jgi:hypothetical protein
MRALYVAYTNGARAAAHRFKIALGPPTQVDQFMADIESGKDVPPPMDPPMSHAPGNVPPALDGTMPLSTSPPTPMDTIGSTVGDPMMAGAPPAMPPPNMGMLGG